MIPFFGQGDFQTTANMTPQQIERKRALMAALMPRFGQAKYVGEGIGQLATGVAMGMGGRKLDAAEGENETERQSLMDRIFGGLSSQPDSGGTGFSVLGQAPSGTWTPAPPAPKPTESFLGMPDVVTGGRSFGLEPADTGVHQGNRSFGSAVMTPQEMLIAGAEARGLDPIDVATAISYETGGRFDPMIKGPTTQWGTHQGLIQFGNPQAAEHGARFDDADTAWRSQLDPNNGAVWSYLDSTGVQPGMGLPEVYSAINAGGVGRMNRTDANNGGAPGTVGDKVASMGPHREKAAQFLGGTWTPSAGQPTMSTQGVQPQMGAPAQSGPDLASLYQALSSPLLRPEDRQLITGLIQQRQQEADPMRALQMQGAQLGLEKSQLEIEKMRNPQPGYRVLTAQEAASMGLPDGAFQVGGDGKVSQIGGAGTNVNVSVGGEGAPGLGKLSTDYGYVLDPETRQPVIDPATGLPQAAPVPGSAAARDIEALQASRSGMETMTARQLNPTIDDITTARDLASSGIGTTGMMSGLIQRVPGVGQDAVDMAGTIDAIGSGISLENLNQMRQNSPTGGALGNVSDKQSALLSEAFGSLRQSMSREQFLYNLARVENSLNDIVHGEGNGPERHNMAELRARLRSGGGGSSGASAPADTFEAFAATPTAQAAAERYGVSLEEMWAIKQGLQ